MDKRDCEHWRKRLKEIADDIMSVRGGHLDMRADGEVMANFMLAYRHIEDASMRLGKCIQHLDGVSVYDKTQVPGA